MLCEIYLDKKKRYTTNLKTDYSLAIWMAHLPTRMVFVTSRTDHVENIGSPSLRVFQMLTHFTVRYWKSHVLLSLPSSSERYQVFKILMFFFFFWLKMYWQPNQLFCFFVFSGPIRLMLFRFEKNACQVPKSEKASFVCYSFKQTVLHDKSGCLGPPVTFPVAFP